MKISTTLRFGGSDTMGQGIDLEIENITDEVLDDHFANLCENVKIEVAKRREVSASKDPT